MNNVNGNIPRHLGIILDGNRRFAKRLMIKPWMGHEWGAKKVKELLEWCNETCIEEVTFYAFSVENFNRPKDEFDYLMALFEKEFNELMSRENLNEINKKGLRVNFIGRLWMFPANVQGVMNKLMDLTKENNKHIVNFAMAYGGRAEIIDATKKIAKQIKEGNLDVGDLNEEVFKKNLYLESEPDLIIRTSESRLSGFLLWQSSYAEIIFLPDLLWPEFKKEDFLACINEYSLRKRKFGK